MQWKKTFLVPTYNLPLKTDYRVLCVLIAWNDKTFKEYLTHKGLTPNLIHYVLYAIASGNNRMGCLDGVRECKKFLMSLGRYGNTPFLWPMYGSGELPQCFCR